MPESTTCDKCLSYTFEGGLQSSCGHKTCPNCIIHQIIKQSESIISTEKNFEDEKLKCSVCVDGEIISDKKELTDFAYQITKKKEDICGEHQKKLRMNCTDCNKLVCGLCIASGHDEHNIENISKIEGKQSDKCKEHSKKLDLVCNTCESNMICSDCKDNSHKDHMVTEAEIHYNKIRVLLKNEKRDKINKFCENVKNSSNEINQQIEETYGRIQKKLMKMIKRLQDYSDDLEKSYNSSRLTNELNIKISEKITETLNYEVDMVDQLEYSKIDLLNTDLIHKKIQIDNSTKNIKTELKNIKNQIKKVTKTKISLNSNLIRFEKKQTIENDDTISALTKLKSGELVSNYGEDRLKIWKRKNDQFECIQTIRSPEIDVYFFTALIDDCFASVGFDRIIKIWKNIDNNFECIQTLEPDDGIIYSLCLLKNGNFASGSQNNKIKIWEKKDGIFECVQTIEAHDGKVFSLCSIDGEGLISGSQDNKIKVWVDNDGKFECVQTIDAHNGTVFSLTQVDVDRIISTSQDKKIKIWKKKEGKLECLQTIEANHNCSKCLLVALRQNSRDIAMFVTSYSENSIKLWVDNDGIVECVQTMKGHEQQITSLISLNNGAFASVSDDQLIKIWDLRI